MLDTRHGYRIERCWNEDRNSRHAVLGEESEQYGKSRLGKQLKGLRRFGGFQSIGGISPSFKIPIPLSKVQAWLFCAANLPPCLCF